MAKNRTHVTYDLKVGNTVVYRGETNDPDRRSQEHQADGKKFSIMEITSVRISRDTAKARESENLARYRDGHGGKNPKYNQTDKG